MKKIGFKGRYRMTKLDCTTDYAKAVRCKNCKYHIYYYCIRDKHALRVSDNDFCSYGERSDVR